MGSRYWHRRARVWPLTYMTKPSVAKDRSWFDADYKPISSVLTSDAPVIGIGTVHLPVKQTPAARHRGHGTLTLRNVLHVPSALCNIIGTPLFHDYKVTLAPIPGSDGTISLSDGTPVGYFAPGRRLTEVRLSGPPIGPRVGPSPFKPDVHYWINAEWSETEREKWLRAGTASTSGDAPQTPAQPTEEEEERWLHRHIDGGRRTLMRRFGLSTHDDEDREVASHIIRRMMADHEAEIIGPPIEYLRGQLLLSEIEWLEDHHGNLEAFMQIEGLDPADQMDVREAICRMDEKMRRLDDSDDLNGSDFDDSDDSSDFDWDNGAPEKLLCNSYFERDELRWVKARYGDAVSFMLLMGLKFNDPGDGEKASDLVRSFMAGEATPSGER
ncbi:hypothetical protein LLEC1_02167 [Akanthomyces lecanii]|uniref:Uncharacterized protein n=1 Tax=Cordyceps confragosa TaxID=2714763 RepID=A0A179IHN4_CORDF|nr:hypothetical protein LLEC1_02167 [Akanthomyces lecanii]